MAEEEKKKAGRTFRGTESAESLRGRDLSLFTPFIRIAGQLLDFDDVASIIKRRLKVELVSLYGNLVNAINTLQNSDSVLLVVDRPQTLNTDLSIPENITLYVEPETAITVNAKDPITGEQVGTGDGTTTIFTLADPPVKSGSDTIYVNGTAQTRGTDYAINYSTGQIGFATAPASGATITADYIPLYVLTIDGGIEAGLWQIFDGDGQITGTPRVKAAYPEWFGAKGDGVTDDTNAIQKTVDLFSSTILQDKTYRITIYITVPSYRKIIGSGYNTVIWNDGSTSKQMCVVIGNMVGDPSAFTDLSHRGPSGVAYTTTTASLNCGNYWVQVADVSIFNVDDLVWLYSQNEGFLTGGGKWLPKYQQINKILEVDGANSKIRLENVIYEDVTDTLYIVKNKNVDGYYIAEGVTVEGIRFIADSDAWYRLGGAYKCYIKDVWVHCSGSGIVLNGFAYSTLENLYAFCSRSNVDLGHFSHHSIFKNCSLSSYRASPSVAVVGLGEGCHHNIFENCNFESNGNLSIDDPYYGIYVNNSRVKFSNCSFVFDVVKRAITVYKNSTSIYGEAIFENCDLILGECNYIATADSSSLILRQCYLKGKPDYNVFLLGNSCATPEIIGEKLTISIPSGYENQATVSGLSAITNISHTCCIEALYADAFPDREDLYTVKQYMPFEVKKYGWERSIARMRGTQITSDVFTTVIRQYLSPYELTDQDLVEICCSGVANGASSTKTVRFLIYTYGNAGSPEFTRDFTVNTGTSVFLYRATGGVVEIGSPYWRLKFEAYDGSSYSVEHETPNVDTTQAVVIEVQVKIDTAGATENIIPDVCYIKELK